MKKIGLASGIAAFTILIFTYSGITQGAALSGQDISKQLEDAKHLGLLVNEIAVMPELFSTIREELVNHPAIEEAFIIAHRDILRKGISLENYQKRVHDLMLVVLDSPLPDETINKIKTFNDMALLLSTKNPKSFLKEYGGTIALLMLAFIGTSVMWKLSNNAIRAMDEETRVRIAQIRARKRIEAEINRPVAEDYN